MKKEEIIEGNKLIAEFMGEHTWTNLTTLKQEYNGNYQYHSSWDWLMPVVQKIYFDDLASSQMWDYISSTFRRPNIESVWLIVVEFIKFFNQK